MQFGHNGDDLDAPDAFLERNLQVQLAKLWYSTVRQMKSWQAVYDAVAVEEHYEDFRRNFLSKLPAIFALDSPNKHWDEHIPEIPRQRQLLRISIFSYLCQIYRRLLHLEDWCIHGMPQYKQHLILRHRVQLVDAAISLLDSVGQLHSDMGRNQTKYFLISFYTFEPAMLLTIHLLNAKITSSTNVETNDPRYDGPSYCVGLVEPSSPSRKTADATRCRAEIARALERLDLLREVSPIAELGARKVHQMIRYLDEGKLEQTSQVATSQPSLCGTMQIGCQSYVSERVFSSGLTIDQQEVPKGHHDGWIDDLLDFSTDNVGHHRTSNSSFDSQLDNYCWQ